MFCFADRPALLAELQRAARALGAVGGGAGVPRLLALLCDPDAAPADVLRALQSEPGLAARVLRVANSPFYRRCGEVGTLERAQQVLGQTGLRGIAAAACLDRSLPLPAGTAFQLRPYRLHSLAVACAAQQLSRALGAGIDGEAFMAGLLHDIGLLLLAHAQPATADADHGEAAGVLVQAWSLPNWLLAPLRSHHASGDASGAAAGDAAGDGCFGALPALVQLADQLADRAGLALLPVAEPPALALPPGLASTAVDAIVAGLPDQVAAMAGAG